MKHIPRKPTSVEARVCVSAAALHLARAEAVRPRFTGAMQYGVRARRGFKRAAVGFAAFALLSACGTTSRFVAKPDLTINGAPAAASETVQRFFASTTPYTIRFCNADIATKACKREEGGLIATGVGGLFLPLTLHVRAMVVNTHRSSGDGVEFAGSVDSVVDGIAPSCATVSGRVLYRNDNTASLRLDTFYCNWLVIGNVLVNAELSIDSIEPASRTFAGYYRITFNGTGNAGGSGYYRAVIATEKVVVIGLTSDGRRRS